MGSSMGNKDLRRKQMPKLSRIIQGDEPIHVRCYVINKKQAEIVERFLNLAQLALDPEPHMIFTVEANYVEVLKKS